MVLPDPDLDCENQVNEGAENTSGIFRIYPNPTSDEATIEFTAPRKEDIKIYLFNANGEIIATYDHAAVSGLNTKVVDTFHLSSGVYVVSIQMGEELVTGRLVKMKE